jgi:hypothetical protein
MAILEPTLRVCGWLIVLGFFGSAFWVAFAQQKLTRYLIKHHPGRFRQLHRDRRLRKFLLGPFAKDHPVRFLLSNDDLADPRVRALKRSVNRAWTCVGLSVLGCAAFGVT